MIHKEAVFCNKGVNIYDVNLESRLRWQNRLLSSVHQPLLSPELPPFGPTWTVISKYSYFSRFYLASSSASPPSTSSWQARSLLKGNGWENQISAADTWQAAWKFWLDLRKYFFDLKYEMRSYGDLHFKKGLMSILVRWILTKTSLLEEKKLDIFLVWGIGRVLHVLGERRRLLNYASLLKVSFLLNHQQLTKIFFGLIIIAIGACQRNLGCFILIYFYIEQYYLLFRFPTGLFRTKYESWNMCRV